MGLTFSSPQLQDAHGIYEPYSTFSESYAFAPTDTNDFGIAATLTFSTTSLTGGFTPTITVPAGGLAASTVTCEPIPHLVSTSSVLCPGLANSDIAPGTGTLAFFGGGESLYGIYLFSIVAPPTATDTVYTDTTTTVTTSNVASTTGHGCPVSATSASAGVFPTGVYPTGKFPTGVFPTGVIPSGLFPTGAMPSGMFSSGVNPSVSPSSVVPSGVFPTGIIPSSALPTGIVPSGVLSTGGIPSGILPIGGLSSGVLPKGGILSGGFPYRSANGSASGSISESGIFPSGTLTSPSGSGPYPSAMGSLPLYPTEVHTTSAEIPPSITGNKPFGGGGQTGFSMPPSGLSIPGSSPSNSLSEAGTFSTSSGPSFQSRPSVSGTLSREPSGPSSIKLAPSSNGHYRGEKSISAAYPSNTPISTQGHYSGSQQGTSHSQHTSTIEVTKYVCPIPTACRSQTTSAPSRERRLYLEREIQEKAGFSGPDYTISGDSIYSDGFLINFVATATSYTSTITVEVAAAPSCNRPFPILSVT